MDQPDRQTPHDSPAPGAQARTLHPGTRVRVTQQVPRPPLGGGPMTTVLQGQVVRHEQQTSGSWFAHAKNNRVWLDRLVLRKDDGEVVYLNLDQYSQVEPA